MDIEEIRTTVCLKSGTSVFPKGKIYRAPNIPDVLIEEARVGAATVEVLKRKAPVAPPARTPSPAKEKASESEKTDGPVGEAESKTSPEKKSEEKPKPAGQKKGSKKLLLKKGK